MNQVTRTQLRKGFILFALACNVIGAAMGFVEKEYWGALGHTAAGILMVVVYLEQFEEGKEDDEDEQ